MTIADLLQTARNAADQRRRLSGHTHKDGKTTTPARIPDAEAQARIALEAREQAQTDDPERIDPAWAVDLAVNRGVTPWPIREQALQLCFDICRHTSIRCVSRWLVPGCGEVEGDEWARNDLADVARCDVFVALNPDEWAKQGTGGRHVEFGYAVALRKPVVLIGARTNIFHHLSDVALVKDASDAVRAIHRLTTTVPVEGCPSWKEAANA